jgi:hypothetical protein
MNRFGPNRSPSRPANGAVTICAIAMPEKESATPTCGPPRSSRT